MFECLHKLLPCLIPDPELVKIIKAKNLELTKHQQNKAASATAAVPSADDQTTDASSTFDTELFKLENTGNEILIRNRSLKEFNENNSNLILSVCKR